MSAVVEEPYSGLPSTHAAERPAVSDPVGVFREKPEVPAFVLTCSGLPSEHQRTHGLKGRRQNYPERLDCAGQLPCPGLMDLLPKEPVEAGGLVEEDKTPGQILTKQRSFRDCPRESLGAAEDMAEVAVESLVPFSQTAWDACCSEEKEPWLVQEGKDFSPSPSSTERAAVLQNLEENPANVQVTSESLSKPMLETQGMTADGTGLFSKTGEDSTRGSTGIPPESSECSDLDPVHAKVAVSGVSTLVSLEPFTLLDDASPAEGQLPEEEEWEDLSAFAPLSAATKVLSSLQGGGDQLLGQEDTVCAISSGGVPAQQEEMDFHEATSTAPVAESKTPAEGCGASAPLFESNLELGTMLWEESADVQVVCEVEAERSAGSDENFSRSSCEKIELLEEWASEPKVDESLWQTGSSDELSSDSEEKQGMESCADHAYSCLWRRIPEAQKVASVHWSVGEDVQEGPPSEEEGLAALMRTKSTNPESGVSLLRDDVRSSDEEEGDPGSSGSGKIKKEEGSLCPPPRGGGLVIGMKEERTLLEEAKSCVCFQNSFSASSDSPPSSSSSSSSSSWDSSGPGSQLNEGDLLETESSSNQRTNLLERASSSQRPVVDVSFAKDDKHSEATLFGGELSLTQEEDMDVGGPEFMDSLLKGDPSGTCAKLATQNTSYFLQNKEDLSSACHNGGPCVTASGNLEYTRDVKPGDAGKRVADVERAWSGAHNPGEQSRNNLCLSVEICCTRSGDVSCEAQKVGAQAGREDGNGLEVGHSSIPEKKASLPWACDAGDPGACPAYEGSLDDLDGAEPTPNAVCPAGLSPPGLSATGAAESCAEAKAQRMNGGESVMESEGIPDGVFTPIANLQQEPRTDDSLEVESDGPDRVETVRTEGGGQGRALAGKPAQDRDLEETVLCELARLVKDHSKEDSEGNHNPPTFPSASHLSNLEPRLGPCCPGQAEQQGCSLLLLDLHPLAPDQPRKIVGQQETQLGGPQNGRPHSPMLFNQKNKASEAASLFECSPLPLMFSERQNGDPVISTVTHSAEEAQKQASRHQNESPGLQKTQGLTLPASKFLLEKDVQETFQPNTGGSSDKMVAELTENPWKEDPKELENSKLCLGGLESLPRTPKWHPVQDQPYQVKTEQFCSVPAAVGGDLSDVPDEKPSLKCNSKPASPPGQTCFQPDLPTFILLEDQRSTEGVDAESFRNKKRSNLASLQPLQTPGSWLSQGDGLFSLPASQAPSSPRDEEHPSGTFSAESKAGDQVDLVISEKAHVRFSVKEATCVDSALATPETGICSVGDKQRTGGIVLGTPKRSPDPTLKETELSPEESRRLSSPATDSKDSLGIPVQSLVFPVGTEERAFPREEKIEIQTPWVSLPEGASECGVTQAKDPSKSTENIERHEGYAWQLFPKRNSPEILSKSVTLAFQGSRLSEAPTPCLRRQGRCLQAAGATREPAGDQKKLLLPERPSGSHATEALVKTGASELGGGPKPTVKALEQEAEPTAAQAGAACGGLRQWNRTKRQVGAKGFLRRRILATGHIFGSSSLRRRVKPGDPEHQAFLRRSLLSSRGSGTLPDPLREPGRPKRSADFMELRPMEGGSPKLGFREPIRPSEDQGHPLPVSCVLSKSVGFSGEGSRRAFESACRRKPMLLFGKQSERVPALGKFKAQREALLRPSPASLKNPRPEGVPRPGIKPMGATCSATALATPRSKRAVTWDCAPNPRGSQSTRLDPFRLGRRAKDPPLLRKLSMLADKLLAPSRNPRKFKPLLRSSELLPVPEKLNHLRSQKLPEMFSCVSIKLNAPWMNSSGSGCFGMFHSQPVGFYPIESTKVCCFFGLDSKAPLAFCAPVFPVSFHVQMDPSPTRNLPGSTALLSASRRATAREVPPTGQASGWTFSFLLSPSCLNVAPIQKDAQSSSLSAVKALVGDAITQNLRGLQTVLALLSPGCSRLWTKKRRLAHRSPSLPKPMLLPFAQGLKGFRKGSPSGPADLFSSVPPSLGRVLSIWNRQGPSTGPSKLPPLLSACYKGQPVPAAAASLSLRNSSAVLPPLPDQFLEASAAVTEDARWEPPFPAFSPTSRPVAEPAPSRLGLSAPEFQAHRLDELDASAPALPRSDSPLKKAESEKRLKRVSQIRIRKTIPKPDPNLTPMGLPRPKRLKKTEFSLEEIYTNQNYKSPPATRCLETIFEEPKERNGSLVSISHQKRKRILEFQDFTVPRKRKARGRVKVTGSFTRAQKAAVEGRELDILLIQKLTDLETFFAKQEEQRDAPGS